MSKRKVGSYTRRTKDGRTVRVAGYDRQQKGKTSADALASDQDVESVRSAASASDGPTVLRGNVKKADLRGQDLRQVTFAEGTVLHEGTLDRSNAREMQLDASFTHSSFVELDGRHVDLSRGVHIASDFENADLAGSSLTDNDAGSFRGVDARGATMRQKAFDDTDWSYARVNGAFIYHCGFYGADLSEIVGLDEATCVHNFFDARTKFPQGYDPVTNGWIVESKPRRLLVAQQRMRDAARTGVFDPLTNYVG